MLVLLATLFILHTLSAESNTIKIVINEDARVEVLSGFFQRTHSPLVPLAMDFLQAADNNGLDWRLLPSIAMVESGGGINYKNSNIFGWGNGNIKFDSIRGSIHYLASRLVRSRLYSGKELTAVLRTYNPVLPEYPERVMRFMRRLSDPPSFARIPSMSTQSIATVREAPFHCGNWSAGPVAVLSRRAKPVANPVRQS